MGVGVGDLLLDKLLCARAKLEAAVNEAGDGVHIGVELVCVLSIGMVTTTLDYLRREGRKRLIKRTAYVFILPIIQVSFRVGCFGRRKRTYSKSIITVRNVVQCGSCM